MQLNYEAEVFGDSVCWIIQKLWVKKTCYVTNQTFFSVENILLNY